MFTTKQRGAQGFLSASIFSVERFLPKTFLGWFVWLVIVFVIVSQARRVVLSGRKRNEEKKQRDQEMKEMRRYQQETVLKSKQPA